MGGCGCKPFLQIGSKSVIERTVGTLLSSPYIEHLVVLSRADDVDRFGKLGFDKRRVSIVPGGATRQQSVKAGLDYLALTFPALKDSYILVHDAARCLTSPSLVSRMIEGAFQYKAVTAAIPLADSLKRVDDRLVVEESLKREHLVAVQTPQVFAYRLLQAAHDQAKAEATDDASLVEAIHPVQVILGEARNFKLTTPEDLEMARRLVED